MIEPATKVRTRAVFFDVDFTLIYPGPAFQASGYREFCSRFDIEVDPAKFDAAVIGAATFLEPESRLYDAQLYIDYTRRIIEGMGGTRSFGRGSRTRHLHGMGRLSSLHAL